MAVVGLIIFLMMYLYNDRFRLYAYTSTTSHFYLFMVVFACLVGSICLLLSCLFSLSTASIIAKTLYEFIFHGVAFLLYLVAMIFYFVNNKNTDQHPYSTVGPKERNRLDTHVGNTLVDNDTVTAKERNRLDTHVGNTLVDNDTVTSRKELAQAKERNRLDTHVGNTLDDNDTVTVKEGVFTAQRKDTGHSYVFRELGLLTLPCLYILEVDLYCRLKCELIRGKNFHQHGSRGRDNFRVEQHRTAAFKHLPSQVGVGLINRLPLGIKQLNETKKFKTRLKHFLMSKAFYSTDEFMMGHWDESFLNKQQPRNPRF
ncbi:hypothetical protein J6590_014532 [Homalodisca vitripennis]|nr:hypothetical protein J6590_014532 [Homalodisca vitripennis]